MVKARDSGGFVLPVILREGGELPVFLTSRHKLWADDLDGIVRAILSHLGLAPDPRPKLAALPKIEVRESRLTIERDGERVRVSDGRVSGSTVLEAGQLERMRAAVALRGPIKEFGACTVGDQLHQLGRELGTLLFPGEVSAALAAALDARGQDTQVCLRIRARDPELLSLAWEAA